MATQDKTIADVTEQERQQDTICFAELNEGVVVVRVFGRGNFANSVELKNLSDAMFARTHILKTRVIIDLERCTTMDSTFMGILASIGLRQMRDSASKTAIVNANVQTDRLLRTLGLSHFLDVCPTMDVAPTMDVQFHTAESDKVDKVGQIVHMIQAHECLCDADSQNEVRFESVLKYLNESLKREEPQ